MLDRTGDGGENAASVSVDSPGNVPMSTFRPARSLRFLVPLAILLHGALVAGPAPRARGDDADAPVDPSAELHVRYAEARLKLARLDLERAEVVDDRAGGGGVSETDMRRLRARVRMLESLVGATRSNPHGNGLDGHLARARVAVEIATEDLESAERTASTGAMDRIMVERYRTRLEIAELRLALLEDPTNVPSPFDQMQLQIDQLTDHVLDLLDQIENQDTIIPPR